MEFPDGDLSISGKHALSTVGKLAGVLPATGDAVEPDLDAEAVRASFRRRSGRPQWVVRYFYAHLFAVNPEIRAMFPQDMEPQRDRLFRALCGVIDRVDDLPALSDYLTDLGRGHRRFNLRPEHYTAVGESLIATLKFIAGPTWTPTEESHWVTAYNTIAATMQAAEKYTH